MPAKPETEVFTVDVDVRVKGPNTPTGQNSQFHFARAAKRRHEREKTQEALSPYEAPDLTGQKLHIHLVRMAPGTLDDDNLAFACKTVRDTIAEWLNVDDADPRLKWTYAQAKVRERALIPQGKRKPPKMGLRTWLRVTMTLDTGSWPFALPSVTQERPRPFLDDEDIQTEGEPAIWGEPRIGWSTKPGTPLVVLHRTDGGMKGTTPTDLVVTLKKRPNGEPYVHFAVHFEFCGKPFRSRGAAVRAGELAAVVAALQGQLGAVLKG